MSTQIFTGSISYCTRKCHELKKRGWKVESYRNIYGGKQVWKMVYVGMVQTGTGRWVARA